MNFIFEKKFLFLILAFVLLRLLTLLTAVEVVYQSEELYRGAVANEMIRDVETSLVDYRPEAYSGGFLIVGFLVTLFFQLFGASLFSLKLVSFLFAFASFLAVLFFIHRFFNKQAAFYAGLLFLFAPPVLTALSLVTNGCHAEGMFFSILMLFCFYEILYGSSKPSFWACMLGMISGFAFWFIPTTAGVLIAILVTWVVIRPRLLWGKLGFLFVVGLILGLLPWIFENFQSGFGGVLFARETFGHDQGLFAQIQSTVIRLGQIFLIAIPFGFFLGIVDQPLGIILSLLYLGLTATVIGCAFLQKYDSSKEKTLFFIFYPLIYIGISALSIHRFDHVNDFHGSFRFFSGVYFFALILIAIGVSLLPKKRGIFFLVSLLLLGGVGQSALVFKEPFGEAFRNKGYSYFLLGEAWAEKNEFSSQAFQDLPEPHRKFFYWGWASESDWSRVPVHEILVLPHEYYPYVLESYGSSFGYNAFSEKNAMPNFPEEARIYLHQGFASALVRLNEMPMKTLKEKQIEKYFWFSFGVEYFSPHVKVNLSQLRNWIERLEPENRQWLWRGMGRVMPRECLEASSAVVCDRFFVGEFPESIEHFAWGRGWGIGEDWLEDPIRAWRRIQKYPKQFHQSAKAGLLACLAWYGIDLKSIPK